MEKIRLLLYCTKSKPNLIRIGNNPRHLISLDKNPYDLHPDVKVLNGKIVAECDFEVEEIRHNETGLPIYTLTKSKYDDFIKNSCLTIQEAVLYLNSKSGYAIHIKNLNIFDKPRELNNIFRLKEHDKWYMIPYTIKRPPQNMIRCYYEEYGTDILHNYILISIRPEWLCKILNGEKTIEIRKKVLKEMVK